MEFVRLHSNFRRYVLCLQLIIAAGAAAVAVGAYIYMQGSTTAATAQAAPKGASPDQVQNTASASASGDMAVT